MDGHAKDTSVSPPGVGNMTTDDVASMAAIVYTVWARGNQETLRRGGGHADCDGSAFCCADLRGEWVRQHMVFRGRVRDQRGRGGATRKVSLSDGKPNEGT